MDQWCMKGIVGSDLLKYPCGTAARPRDLKQAAEKDKYMQKYYAYNAIHVSK